MLTERLPFLPKELPEFAPFPPASNRAAWETLPPALQARFIKHAEDITPLQWGEIPFSLWISFSRTGNRDQHAAQYFPRREQLTTLVCAECVSYQGRFIEDILHGIWLICEESAWQLPAHNNYIRDGEILPLPDTTRPIIDLFAAETGALLSMCKYLLADVLEAAAPGICARIDAELEKRILKPYFNDRFWWMADAETLTCNWTTWCVQNVLLTLLLSSRPNADKKEGITKACKSLDFFLNEYADDGCCSEGAQYFAHAGLTLWGSLNILTHVANDAFSPIFAQEKLKNIAEYILNMHVTGTRYFNFGDCSPVAGHRTARDFLFGKAVGSDALMSFAARDILAGPNPEHLRTQDNVGGINLWYRLLGAFTLAEIETYAQTAQTQEKPASYKWYESVGLYIRRNSTYALCAKAGGNDDSHNHNDTGSVTLYKNGQPFLIDIGVETYTRKTFSPNRYDIWAMQSAWHNLPTFDGMMQQDGASFAASNVEATEHALTMELATAYPTMKKLSSYLRNVSLTEQSLTLVDQTDYDGRVTLTLMTQAQPIAQALDTSSGEIKVGALGTIHYVGGAPTVACEAISITDPRLRTAWPDTLYKTTICFEKTLTLTIV